MRFVGHKERHPASRMDAFLVPHETCDGPNLIHGDHEKTSQKKVGP